MSNPLVDEILESARLNQKGGWLGRLREEQRAVVVEVRDRWRDTKATSGVAAAQLARSIVAAFPDAKFPTIKEVAAWLNRAQ